MKERAPGCLGYIVDEILASYVGVIRNHGNWSLEDVTDPLEDGLQISFRA